MNRVLQIFILVVSINILLFDCAFSQPVNFQWAQGMGGKNSSTGAVDITRDPQGNIYITGEFEGTRTFGLFTLFATGFREVFIAKYDSLGNCLWAKKAGANFSSAYSGGVAFSDGFVYLSGYYTNSIIYQTTPLVSKGLNALLINGPIVGGFHVDKIGCDHPH